jgi:hypothetical protein
VALGLSVVGAAIKIKTGVVDKVFPARTTPSPPATR